MRTELALYQALVSINVPEPKVIAVIEALESDMTTLLATKADLAQVASDMKHQVTELKANMKHQAAELKADMSKLETQLTLRLGTLMVATVGVFAAVMKLIQ